MQRPSQVTSSAAFDRFVTTRHLPGLDGLRGLAILPVIWHHSTPRLLPGVLGKGAVGVDLFFALSGFLITTLLLRERRERGSISLGAFYARRSLRIFPLYYAVLAAYAARALTSPASFAPAAHFLRSLPYHATYTANWFVDYSVPHDVIFAFSWTVLRRSRLIMAVGDTACVFDDSRFGISEASRMAPSIFPSTRCSSAAVTWANPRSVRRWNWFWVLNASAGVPLSRNTIFSSAGTSTRTEIRLRSQLLQY